MGETHVIVPLQAGVTVRTRRRTRTEDKASKEIGSLFLVGQKCRKQGKRNNLRPFHQALLIESTANAQVPLCVKISYTALSMAIDD